MSLVVVSVLMLAALSAFGSSLGASKAARRTTDAAIFLEATLENLAAQNFDAVLAMNGNRFFDGEDEDSSRYAADLVAFQSSVDLMQVELDLVDLQTNRRLGRLATLRSR